MKKILYFVLASSILISFLSSCSRTPNNFEAIPQNAMFVAVVNTKSVLKKARISELRNLKIYRDYKKEAYKENKDFAKKIEQYLQKPKSLGIRLLRPISLFLITDDYDMDFTVVAFDLSNSEKFKEATEDLLHEADLDFDYDEETKYETFKVEDDAAIIAFDKNKALVIVPNNYSSRDNLDFITEELMTLDKENRLTENKHFKEFVTLKKDFYYWINPQEIADKMDLKVDVPTDGFGIDVDFGSKEIKSHIQYFYKEYQGEKFKELINGKFDSDLKKLAPYPLHFLVTFGDVDFKRTLEYMQDQFSKEEDISEDLEKAQDYIDGIGGSLLLAVTDFNKVKYKHRTVTMVYNPKKYVYTDVFGNEEYEGGYEWKDTIEIREKVIPYFVIAASVKDKDKLDDLLDRINKDMPDSLVVKRSKYIEYKFEEQEGINYYIRLTDKYFLFTNNYDYIKEVARRDEFKNNLNKAPFAGKISSSYAFTYADLNLDNYKKVLIDELKDQFSNFDDIKRVLNYFDHLMLYSPEFNQLDVSITMRNVQKNTLYTLLVMLDEIYKAEND